MELGGYDDNYFRVYVGCWEWHLGVWGLVVDTVRCMYKYYRVIGNAMLQVCEGEI